jgi:dTDP-4-amino-4,6-dideoxygalactose transaminase
MIKFWEPNREYFKHKEEILNAIDSCLSRGEMILGFGEEIGKFERRFADYVGMKHGIMVGGGTHALYTAYRAHGIGPGDEVITTSHTFVATIDQIHALGATPILVDIAKNGLIDVDLIEDAITSRTKAIVPVHLEGKICDMKAMR